MEHLSPTRKHVEWVGKVAISLSFPRVGCHLSVLSSRMPTKTERGQMKEPIKGTKWLDPENQAKSMQASQFEDLGKKAKSKDL